MRTVKQAAWPAAVVSLSLLAAGIHARVAPEHFEEWWGYGAFFVLAAVAEAAYAVLVLLRPTGRVLQLGIWCSLATMLMYVVSRTGGVPLGPEAGAVEGVDALGLVATAAEAGLLLALCARLGGPVRRRTLNGLAVAGAALWIAAFAGALTPPETAVAEEGHGHHGSSAEAAEPAGDAAHEHDARAVLPFIPDRVRTAPRAPGLG